MCDTLVARGPGTADGATLFAKNSDRRGREPQPFVQFPAAYHARGSVVRCTHIEIDQVAETYRVMGHSPQWCWGFEQGVNEHGVAIGNHATWSREPLESTPGLIGMDLVRLGLERGRDAREALEVIAALLETHGQGGAAFATSGDDGYQNSFAIADGHAAWVLETTARGWAARSVEGAALSNTLTLGRDWQIGSRDLERQAMQQGFWSREGRLDFKAAYGVDPQPRFLTDRRLAASRRLLSGPPLTVAAMKVWACDHGASEAPPAADLAPKDPDRYSVCMHADPLSTTTASLVVRLPEQVGRRPWPVWISFATPCTGLFIPVYLDGVIPAALASSAGPRANRAAEPYVASEVDENRLRASAGRAQQPSHEGGAAGGGRDRRDRRDVQHERRGAWEALRSLQERAIALGSPAAPILEAGWRELERQVEWERIRVEQEATGLFATDRFDEGERVLSRFMERTSERLIETSGRLGRALEDATPRGVR